MRNYLIFIQILCFSLFSFGQTDCDNNVSTDFTNPTNNALPQNSDSLKYLNGFNWYPTTASGLEVDYEVTNMFSDGDPIYTMNNIMFTSLPYYNYIDDGPLPLNENGWELLLVNLGRFPDDTTSLDSVSFFDGMPYIVLYNRYSGVIRVFVSFGSDYNVGDGPDAIEVELMFPNENVSGLLRLAQGRDDALSNESKVRSMKSIAKGQPDASQWVSTDFQIAYDPCTCYFPSEIHLNFTQVLNSDIALHGRALALDELSLLDTAVFDPKGVLTGFDYTGGSADGGILIYKTMDALLDDYIKKLEEYNLQLIAVNEHNEKVKTNLAILRMAKFTIAILMTVPTGGTSGSPAAIAAAAEAAAAIAAGALSNAEKEEQFEGTGVSSSDGDWFKVVQKHYKQIVTTTSAGQKALKTDELLNSLKLILGDKGDAFIARNFEPKALPSAPTVPTTSFSEMHYEGHIRYELLFGGPKFYSPGSYGSGGTGSPTITSTHEYPVYNDVLGIFALLESPKINITPAHVHDVTNVVNEEILTTGIGDLTLRQRYQAWRREYQIQLTKELKFALNDVLDISDYKIQASFNVEVESELSDNLPIDLSHTSRVYNAFHDLDLSVNYTSNWLNTHEYAPIKARDDEYTHLLTDTIPNLAEANFGDTYPYTVDRNPVQFQSQYVPIDAFQSFNSALSVLSECATTRIFSPESGIVPFDPQAAIPNSQGFSYNFTKVELKLVVDVEFNTLNSDGEKNSATYVLTYLIDPSDITYSDSYYVPDLANSGGNFGEIENLEFVNVNFDGSEVDGCELTGDNYKCKAWSDISISGDITVEPGFTVAIIAGNEIIVSPESEISPEVELSIAPVLDFSNPNPQVDQAYVTSYCQGTLSNGDNYSANTVANFEDPNGGGTKKNLVQNVEVGSQFELAVFPNPSSNGRVSLRTKGVESNERIVFAVHDLMGKTLDVSIQVSGANEWILDMVGYPKGVYLIHAVEGGNVITKRLVIQ